MKKLFSFLVLGFSFMFFYNPSNACDSKVTCANGEILTCNGDKRCSSGATYVNCWNQDGSFSSSTGSSGGGGAILI